MLLSADRLDFEVIRFGAYLAAAAQEIKKTRSGEKSKLKLMAAATRVLENVSYRDLLVESVCQEAGVAKGTFYIYFASKDMFLKELARGYVNFEIQTYPRLSSKNTAFANTLKWVAWYEKTFAGNVGVLRCIVQMGAVDEEMRDIWHDRNRRVVDRSMIGWMKTHPDADPRLQRRIMRTAGGMLDQSLFERYRVLTGPGLQESEPLERLIEHHAFMNYRAMYATNPPRDELAPDSPLRDLLKE
jgi:AcrR family transcriptional regulator